MKPTISNAFNDESPGSAGQAKRPPTGQRPSNRRGTQQPSRPAGKAGGSSMGPASVGPNSIGRGKVTASLCAMQVDLSQADFGWSLELSPMRAIDAVQALTGSFDPEKTQYLVSIEQSAWRDSLPAEDSGAAADAPMCMAAIAERLAITALTRVSGDQLVLNCHSLRQLTALCQPTRLLVVAVEGEIEPRDSHAMNKAIDAGHSPLKAELRALAALEVLGDRAVVMHSRQRDGALGVVAENFRQYVAAVCQRPALGVSGEPYASPEIWQMDRLLGVSGVLTIRPIETEIFSTSIDVGINTSRERAEKPADRSLIYDIPSNTWHDEA